MHKIAISPGGIAAADFFRIGAPEKLGLNRL
jgi:hypothetical protein